MVSPEDNFDLTDLIIGDDDTVETGTIVIKAVNVIDEDGDDAMSIDITTSGLSIADSLLLLRLAFSSLAETDKEDEDE